jgi:hypothetical protein
METAHAHMTAIALLGALGAVATAMIAITFWDFLCFFQG